MKNLLLLWVCACIICLASHSALATEAKPSHSNSSAFQQGNVSIKGREYTLLKPVLFKDASLFVLHGIAAEYVQQDYKTFQANTDIRKLYNDGIMDAASFIIGEERFENIIGGSVLIFNKRHTQPVVGNIGIGTSLDELRKFYGAPDFEWNELKLTGYKTAQFYIAFKGAEKVERIYIAKRNVNVLGWNIIPAYINYSANKYSFPFTNWGMQGMQLWRGSMTYYRPDGLCIWTDNESDPVFIFNDYTGLVPRQIMPNEVIIYTACDYPEYKINLVVHTEAELQKQFRTKASCSPKKDIAAVRTGATTYERAGLLFRYLDASEPDNFIAPGHFPSDPVWLSERYVGIGTMHGFGIYDLTARPSNEKEAVFYMEFYDGAGPFIKYFNPKTKIIAFDTDRFVIHKKEGKEELQIGEDEYLLLCLHYDKQGNISITIEREKKS